MTSQVQFSYENMGASSYLAAAFLPQAGVVNYQLEMLAANEIRHFLPVTKRVMDGEVIAYYNISSKIALSQILGRRKLSKNELIQLLNGFLSAAEDGEQYQLPAGGLLLDADYIFMDPPYDHSLERQVLELLREHRILRDDGMVIVEASLDTSFAYLEECGFRLVKEKIYKTNKHMFIEYQQD